MSGVNYCSLCTHKVVDAISKCASCDNSYHNSCASRCLTATEGVFSCCLPPLQGYLNIQKKRKAKLDLEESENHLLKITKKVDNFDKITNNNITRSTVNDFNTSKNISNKLINLESNDHEMPMTSSSNTSSLTLTNDSVVQLSQRTQLSPSSTEMIIDDNTYNSNVSVNKDKDSNTELLNITQQTQNSVFLSRLNDPNYVNTQNELSFRNFMVDFAKLVAPTVVTLPENFKNINNKIQKNTENIEDLKNRLSILENDKSNNIDTTYAEFIERERRSKNIILHGLPEPTSSSPIKDDIRKVIEIFNNLKTSNIKINTNNIKVFRLGEKRLDSDDPRSVCIKLNNKDDVIKLIVNRDKLLPYKISTDKTAMQRNQLKMLIQERDNHNALFPNEPLEIKYTNGVPKLIKALNANHKNNTLEGFSTSSNQKN